MATEHLLLGFLRARSPLALAFEARGITSEKVLDRLYLYCNRELLITIEIHIEHALNTDKFSLEAAKVFALLGASRIVEAAELARELLSQFPDQTDVIRSSAYVAGFEGDLAGAAQTLKALVEREPSAKHWTASGEALRCSGDRAGALHASKQLDDDPNIRGNLRALQASVTDDPHECLSLCAQARQWPDCPMSVMGTEGMAYFRKGPDHYRQARLALEKFVRLGLEHCLECDLRSRQDQAGALLAGELLEA